MQALAAILMEHRIEGVIATNTTIARDGGRPSAPRQGDRRPLRARRCARRRRKSSAGCTSRSEGALPIIGVGGILSGADAQEKIAAGATLVQFYTGMVYRGPDLVEECARAVA